MRIAVAAHSDRRPGDVAAGRDEAQIAESAAGRYVRSLSPRADGRERLGGRNSSRLMPEVGGDEPISRNSGMTAKLYRSRAGRVGRRFEPARRTR